MRPLSPAPWRPSRELIAIAVVLVLYLAANGLIAAARPAMMRTAVASVDSALERDKSSLESELTHWRDEVLDEGRWVATLTNVLLVHRGDTPALAHEEPVEWRAHLEGGAPALD